MNYNENFQKKHIPVDELLSKIRPGSKIFLSSGNAIPALTVSEMIKSTKKNLLDLEIVQLLTIGKYLSKIPDANLKYRLKTFNVGESISREISEGKIDFIPANLIEIPFILLTGAINIDIAIILTSPPDRKGFLNMGIAVDVADIIIRNASIVVAEINTSMPVTHGETSIHYDQVDYIIESNIPIIERERKKYDSTLNRIGWHISNLIEDDSTVALHVGRIYDAIASHLKTKQNLGVFTNVISDWAIDLIESGAISHDKDRFDGGQVTTSYCYGTRELYDYVDSNPVFEFHPLARTANPYDIGRVPNLVSIMNVKRIDISGESVIFHSGDNLISGYESKLNFAFGSTYSKNGKSIVALTSIDQNGNSNIVISHDKEQDRVRAILGTVRYIVTEYGIANLFGKSIRERVLAMIDIAHPKHRESLLDQAKELGYAYRDQIYVMEHALNYPTEFETVKKFKDDLEIKLRPIKPSDADMIRRLFYRFSDEANYQRYFARVQAMPHKEMQKYINIDYDRTLSIVGILQKSRTEKIIAEGRYSYYENEDRFELTFIVDEEFWGKGITTFMVNYLLIIAEEKGIKEIHASVLPENRRMLNIFKKAVVKPESRFSGGIIDVKFILE